MIKCDIILFIYIMFRCFILSKPHLIVPLSIISYLGVNKYATYFLHRQKVYYGLEE